MKSNGKLQITTRGEREIVMTRDFDAPRNFVFDALTKPELIRRWLGVRGGWSMSVCEVDLRVGGKYRYVWSGPKGDMGMGGVYREIVPSERIVNTENFDDAWYPGEAIETVVLVERGGITTLTSTVLYESRDARDGVMKSPMESGVADSYDNLEMLIASALTGEPK